MEMSFIQKSIATYDIPPMSDHHGLNLNITVPQDGGENLPVVVYIHGGGFTFGSSSYSHYDQSKVVELSVIMDQPIVAVNFKYACLTSSMISLSY
jgi:carboxylesterase type B